MKQVDILAPVGIPPPGLGPPDPARLLAVDQYPDAMYDDFEDDAVSSMSGDLINTQNATCPTIAATDSPAIESFLGTAPVEAYTESDAMCNTDAKSMAVSEYAGNPSGHVNERLVDCSGVRSLRRIARCSAIKKVQPAQLESTLLYTIIWSVH